MHGAMLPLYHALAPCLGPEAAALAVVLLIHPTHPWGLA